MGNLLRQYGDPSDALDYFKFALRYVTVLVCTCYYLIVTRLLIFIPQNKADSIGSRPYRCRKYSFQHGGSSG